VITPDARPRLARQARLRFDARSGKHVLLYPERGLELGDSAAEIALLCTGNDTVAGIVDHLAARHPGEDRARIDADVTAFLTALEERGLLELGGAA
jgi:pyrroloquinoline quinone biosynthesis protein D